MTNTTAPLNFTLADLPARDALAPQDHETMRDYLNKRHAAALQVAENTLDLAETILATGDHKAAHELTLEAMTYIAEAKNIRARRTNLR